MRARCASDHRGPVAALLGALLGVSLLAGPAPGALAQGHAVLYRWVDDRGVIHFTNTPSDARYAAVSRRKPMGPPVERRGADDFDPLIRRTAKLHQLPPALVKAVIRAESNFDPAARSHKGAMGLMQLMPQTAREMGVGDPWRAEENIRGGTRYLRAMVNRFGDVRLALAAYNAGPHNVDRYKGIPPFEETQEYVRRVLAYYRKYHGEFRR